MGNGRSQFTNSFSSTFNTKMFRSNVSTHQPKTEYSVTNAEQENGNSRNKSPSIVLRNQRSPPSFNRRRSVSVDVRELRRMSSAVHENLVKINTVRNVREVYSGLDNNGNNIGEGTWGTVKLVRRRSNPNRKAAVKILKLSTNMKPSRVKELRSEINLLQKIDHPHIAKLYETYEEEGCNLYLVMEYLSGGELFDRVINLGYFRESKAAEAVKQMAGAVHYLHSKGIVHRDLKLENFMYRSKHSDKLVLIDFGLSTRYSPFEEEGENSKKIYMREMVGSSYYMAPEVMKRKYGMECDMWSIGVIAYMLLSGHPPFAGDTDEQIMRRVRKGTYHFNHSAFRKVSANAKDFVEKLLQYEPKSRMSAKQALQHKWLGEHHRKQVQRRSQRRGSMFDTEVVENLRNFVHTNRFRKLALQAVAYATSYEDIAHLQQLFEDVDQDQDGYITMEELQIALKDQPGIDKKFVKRIFTAMDIDKTKKVHLNEFIAATMNKTIMDDEKILREAFRKLDINETGELDRETLAEFLGDRFSKEQINRIFEEFARDAYSKKDAPKKNVRITQAGFVNAMRSVKMNETDAFLSLSSSMRDDEDDEKNTVLTQGSDSEDEDEDGVPNI